MKTRILIGPSTFAELDPTPMIALEKAGFEIVNNPFGRKLQRPELLDLLKGVTGIIAGLESLDRKVLTASELKVISRCGSGMSNVDLGAARELSIEVFSTPDGPTSAVSELTLGALLSLLRKIPVMDRDLHKGKWNKTIGTQLEGKTVAIVGFGRIGRRFSELLAPFDARILIVDPAVDQSNVDFPVLSLSDALAQADIISFHASGEATILGQDEFNFIKPGAFLLNAARGTQIDEAALIMALKKGKIQGAWLDSFQQEPYSGPLTEYEQVILTPHIGSYSIECRRSMEMESVQNLMNAFKAIR